MSPVDTVELSPKSANASESHGLGVTEHKVTSSAARILIAEDEFLVAILLEQDVTEAGYRVVGPFTRFPEALDAVRRGGFDLALLDINMNGQMAYPLADELLTRGVPFIFLSGYGAQDLPERFRGCSRIAKPYDASTLLREVARLAAQKGSDANSSC
jgi:two-component system, response regulator PdtaR